VHVSSSVQFDVCDLLNNVSYVNKEVVSGFEVKVLDSLVGNDLQRVSLLVMLRCQHSLFVSFVVPTHAATDMVGCGVWVNDAVYCGEASLAFEDCARTVIRVTAH